MPKSSLYRGGLLELIHHPSRLTYQYLRTWLTSNQAYGAAFAHLHWPVIGSDQPLIVRRRGELYWDLAAIDATLFGRTIWRHDQVYDPAVCPPLIVDWHKLVRASCWRGTKNMGIMKWRWSGDPASNLTWRQRELRQLHAPAGQRGELERQIAQEVLARLLIVRLARDFFDDCWRCRVSREVEKLLSLYIEREVSWRDWWAKAERDEAKVRWGTWTLEQYLDVYGIRGDEDYELTCPRWREVPEQVAARIRVGADPRPRGQRVDIEELHLPSNVRRWVSAVVELGWLESDLKKHWLECMTALRECWQREDPERLRVVD